MGGKLPVIPPRRWTGANAKAQAEQPRAADVVSVGASLAPDVGRQLASPKTAGSRLSVADEPKLARSERHLSGRAPPSVNRGKSAEDVPAGQTRWRGTCAVLRWSLPGPKGRARRHRGSQP